MSHKQCQSKRLLEGNERRCYATSSSCLKRITNSLVEIGRQMSRTMGKDAEKKKVGRKQQVEKSNVGSGDQHVLSSFARADPPIPEHRRSKGGSLAHAVGRLTHGTHLLPLSLLTSNVR